MDGGGRQHTACSWSAGLIPVLRTTVLPERHGDKAKQYQDCRRHFAKWFSRISREQLRDKSGQARAQKVKHKQVILGQKSRRSGNYLSSGVQA